MSHEEPPKHRDLMDDLSDDDSSRDFSLRIPAKSTLLHVTIPEGRGTERILEISRRVLQPIRDELNISVGIFTDANLDDGITRGVITHTEETIILMRIARDQIRRRVKELGIECILSEPALNDFQKEEQELQYQEELRQRERELTQTSEDETLDDEPSWWRRVFPVNKKRPQ